MTNEERIKMFLSTLRISIKRFSRVRSEIYEEKKNIEIVWSEDSVKTVFDLPKEKRIAVLNFADGYTPGGLVWQGVKTQEEDLCRASNLYLALEKMKDRYPIDGKLLYSTDIKFFRQNDMVVLPVVADVISCPAPISSIVDAERRMDMIVTSAIVHGVDILVLGRWGCGAFNNDWEEYKELWKKVLTKYGLNTIVNI